MKFVILSSNGQDAWNGTDWKSVYDCCPHEFDSEHVDADTELESAVRDWPESNARIEERSVFA